MKKSGFIARVIVSLIIFSLVIPLLLGAQTDQDSNENQIEKSPAIICLALTNDETPSDGVITSSESSSETLSTTASPADHTSSPSEWKPRSQKSSAALFKSHLRARIVPPARAKRAISATTLLFRGFSHRFPAFNHN